MEKIYVLRFNLETIPFKFKFTSDNEENLKDEILDEIAKKILKKLGENELEFNVDQLKNEQI